MISGLDDGLTGRDLEDLVTGYGGHQEGMLSLKRAMVFQPFLEGRSLGTHTDSQELHLAFGKKGHLCRRGDMDQLGNLLGHRLVGIDHEVDAQTPP